MIVGQKNYKGGWQAPAPPKKKYNDDNETEVLTNEVGICDFIRQIGFSMFRKTIL